jgi:DNA-binding SARP family transcriptional activator
MRVQLHFLPGYSSLCRPGRQGSFLPVTGDSVVCNERTLTRLIKWTLSDRDRLRSIGAESAHAPFLDGGPEVPFAAKSAIPYDRDPTSEHWTIDEAARGRLTLFAAPPGYLLTEGIAAALERRGRRAVWLRLGPEDRDPGMFLASLVASAGRLQAAIGRATLELMRARPGPVWGWPPIFAQLGQELAETLAPGGALVLEHAHHLDDSRPTLSLAGQHLLPVLADGATCILTSDTALPVDALPAWTTVRSVDDLRLAVAATRVAIEHAAPALAGSAALRAARLCHGQVAAIAAFRTAAPMLGSGALRRAIGRASSPPQLFRLLAAAWLVTADTSARRALGLALRLGYDHPALARAAIGGDRAQPGPWLQALADSWSLVRPAWRGSLVTVLGSRWLPDRDMLLQAAGFLLHEGAVEQAVLLYLELGDHRSGARAVAAEAGRLLDLGQWETLADWLDRLPAAERATNPRLLHGQGELTAVHGRADVAKRHFALATARYADRDDPDGACRSMLAESAIAADHGDTAHARMRALAAHALAEASGLPWHEAWASWQLGRLASAAGQLNDALAFFDRAADAAMRAGEPRAVALAGQAERLARGLKNMQREQKQHQQAYQALKEVERAAAARLLAHVTVPSAQLEAFLSAYGWSRTPLVLKLGATTPPTLPGAARRLSWWARMRRKLAARKPAHRDGTTAIPTSWPGSGHPPIAPPQAAGHLVQGHATLTPVSLQWRPDAATTPSRPLIEPAPPEATVLSVHLLGTLRVALNGVPVDAWPSGRGRSLFKYLLMHRDPWPTREMLIEAFWPDSAPEAARNSLNVAIHGLRRALRVAANVPVVVFDDSAYRLDPDVRLWLDVDEFERRVASGRQLEEAGDPAAAAEYEQADALYQGDFMANDPNEEWPVLIRERLRLAWLDTLDRLSQLYFAHARYTSCAALCQRVIERDPCREDAHRRLMRCYSRQGQSHLALRQYEACVDTLKAELGVEPEPGTIELNERIRRRQPV